MSPVVKNVVNPVAMPDMELPSTGEVFANALCSIPNLTYSEPDLLVIHPRDKYIYIINYLIDISFMDDLDELSDEFRSELFKLASASRKHRRLRMRS